jgi:hypothetical protein
MGSKTEKPSEDGKIPGMPPEERQNASLILFMLLAQAYYKMLESAVSMASWGTQLDMELNSSYLWVTDNLKNLLANTPELSDFPSKFEPAFPDLYPNTIADFEWEWIGPDAEEFLSTVQRYVHSKKTYEPEEKSPGWIFVEMFRPGVDTAIQRAQDYRKRMSGHVKRMRGDSDKKSADEPENKKAGSNGIPKPNTSMKAERDPPMESGRVEDRVIYVDGEKFLLPAKMTGRHGPVSIEQLKRVAKSVQTHVIITGETGTGKDSLARHLIDLAGIPDGKWVSVNCASIPAERADSDLFGHVKGAFTGANESRPGLLKAHEGGVVFLDEIGALERASQQKLLRFLESFELLPLGADRGKKVVTRIFAATNANVNDVLLHDLRPRFQFEVALPPLRHRIGDIPWLLSHPAFLGDGRTFTGISWRTLCALLVQEYPKNMRDLKNLCVHWRLSCSSDEYMLDDFSIMGAEAASWVEFASFALAALESHSTANCCGCPKPEGAVELCALLLGMMGTASGAEAPLSIKISDLPQLTGDAGRLFNIQMLHAALCKESEKFSRPSEQLATLGEAAGWLVSWRKTYAPLSPRLLDVVSKGTMADLELRVKRPSSAFLATLWDSVRKGWRWEEPGFPAGSELERVLDEKRIEGELRRVAVYCSEGLSNSQIADKPDISKKVSWIQEELQKLRKDVRLERMLPVAASGRKRND